MLLKEMPVPRRKYTREFKESAAKLVSEQGYTAVEAAKSLGVDPNSIRYWSSSSPATAEALPLARTLCGPSCDGCARRTSGCSWSVRF